MPTYTEEEISEVLEKLNSKMDHLSLQTESIVTMLRDYNDMRKAQQVLSDRVTAIEASRKSNKESYNNNTGNVFGVIGSLVALLTLMWAFTK